MKPPKRRIGRSWPLWSTWAPTWSSLLGFAETAFCFSWSLLRSIGSQDVPRFACYFLLAGFSGFFPRLMFFEIRKDSRGKRALDYIKIADLLSSGAVLDVRRLGGSMVKRRSSNNHLVNTHRYWTYLQNIIFKRTIIYLSLYICIITWVIFIIHVCLPDGTSYVTLSSANLFCFWDAPRTIVFYCCNKYCSCEQWCFFFFFRSVQLKLYDIEYVGATSPGGSNIWANIPSEFSCPVFPDWCMMFELLIWLAVHIFIVFVVRNWTTTKNRMTIPCLDNNIFESESTNQTRRVST